MPGPATEEQIPAAVPGNGRAANGRDELVAVPAPAGPGELAVVDLKDRQVDGKVRGGDHYQLVAVVAAAAGCPGSLLLSRRIGHSIRPLGHP